MTTSTARSIVDRLGKGSKLIRGGNEGGPTPNDGVIDIAEPTKYVAFPQAAGNKFVLAPLDPKLAGVTRTTLTHVTTTRTAFGSTDYLLYHSSGGRFYWLCTGGGLRVYLTRASDGSSYSQTVPVTDAQTQEGVRLHIDWDFNGADQPRVTALVLPTINGAWQEVGHTDFVEEVLRPASDNVAFVNGDSTSGRTFPSGEFRYFSIENDGVEVLRIDAERDHSDADSSRSWTDSTSGSSVTIESPDGQGLKALIVDERNVASLDATDDFWDADLPAPAVDGLTGGIAGIVVVESLGEADVWGKILSTVGFELRAYRSSHVAVGRLYAELHGANLSKYAITSLANYTDGERFAVAYRVGEVNGVRKLSIRTNREDWGHHDVIAPIGDLGAVTHLPYRIGSSAGSVVAGYPLGFSEFIPFDFAPSLADLDVAMAAAFEGGGKPA